MRKDSGLDTCLVSKTTLNREFQLIVSASADALSDPLNLGSRLCIQPWQRGRRRSGAVIRETTSAAVPQTTEPPEQRAETSGITKIYRPNKTPFPEALALSDLGKCLFPANEEEKLAMQQLLCVSIAWLFKNHVPLELSGGHCCVQKKAGIRGVPVTSLRSRSRDKSKILHL